MNRYNIKFNFSERDRDSSLIRAFQPLQLNYPPSSLSTESEHLNLKYIPTSRSPHKDGLSPDSGSFTLNPEVGMDNEDF